MSNPGSPSPEQPKNDNKNQDYYTRYVNFVLDQLATRGDVGVFLMSAPLGYIAAILFLSALSPFTIAFLAGSFGVGLKKSVEAFIEHRREAVERQAEADARVDPRDELVAAASRVRDMLEEHQMHADARIVDVEINLFKSKATNEDYLKSVIDQGVEKIRNKIKN